MALRTGKAVYPWEEWLRRGKAGWVVLIRGTDYLCQDHGMASCIRNWGQRNGVSFQLRLQEGRIEFRVREDKRKRS